MHQRLPAWYASRPHPATGRFVYTVNAFIDLSADETEYKEGRPASKLNLRTEKFDRLACHVRGAAKAPVLFPRTNDFVLDSDAFQKLLLQDTAKDPASTAVQPAPENLRDGPR